MRAEKTAARYVLSRLPQGDWLTEDQVPAKVIGQVTDAQKQEWQYYKEKYAELARVRFPAGLKRIG